MTNLDLINKYANIPINTNHYQLASFSEFLIVIKPLIEIHKIEFKYQKRGCKRAGAAQIKKNNNYQKCTIFLDPEIGEFAKINVFIHELMHILLDHLIQKKENNYYLTGPQKEFVVDYLAEYHTYMLTGNYLQDYAAEYNRHRIISYRKDWLKRARISQKQINIIELQINYGIEILTEYFWENL